MIGFKNIYGLFKKYPVQTESIENSEDKFNFLQVALVTFANGGDNIGIYAPLFSGMSALDISWAILIFLVMTGLWCLFSIKMVENRVIGIKLRKYGHIILPFVLIVIGILIIIRGFI
jgi:cadmium resistance protein CadD (predicted permease)